MKLDFISWFIRKFHVFMLAVFVMLIPLAKYQKQVHFTADHSADKTDYPYVMIHGFLSWNEDADGGAYQGVPYWGMFNGDCLKAYREAGFTCVAPSVDPGGSVWHRVCEAYAKLTGTRVDYGKAHSEACNHERFGEDYTGKAMLDQWDAKHKVNLIGHSLGGKDVILLTGLLAGGSEAERKATTDGSLSGLFTGGKAEWIHACVGVSAVYNGTTLFVDQSGLQKVRSYLNDEEKVQSLLPSNWSLPIEVYDNSFSRVLEGVSSDGVVKPDTAIYDMHPDNAVAQNKDIPTAKNVYYISLIFEDMRKSKLTGRIIMDYTIADPLIGMFTPLIASINTVTPGGLVIDESWQMNDGCVNTISQRAPFGAPTNDLSAPASVAVAGEIQPGVYNILPCIHATHMWAIGDFVRPQLDGPEYLMHVMEMINAI